MEHLQTAIMAQVTEHLPELSLVDEDWGQLQALLNGEDTYPVTFPCVLIGDIKGKWENATPFTQQGQATVTVRLAFDCYDDTHAGSGTEGKVQERLQLENRLYKSLQAFRVDRDRLRRTESTQFSLPGGIKVYETIFSFKVVDSSAVPGPER